MLDRHSEPLLPQAFLVELGELLMARLRYRTAFGMRLARDPRRPLYGHPGDGPPQPPHHPVDRL